MSEEAISAFLWLIWATVWLWSMPVARVIHWEWLRGLSVAEAEVSGGEAALQRRNPPACAFGHLKGATAYENLRRRESGLC